MEESKNKLVNRVAASSLITFKLEEYFPQQDIVTFDIKDYLFKGLMLKEKDFRTDMKSHDWSQYQDKIVLVHCSTDAIVPVWAYMLVTVNATPYAVEVFQGTQSDYYTHHYRRVIEQLDLADFVDQRIVIKGCSDLPVPTAAYVNLTKRLQPVAKSILFGEPCSTVPVYKKKG